MLPNMLIIGAQRSGTSSLNHYLRQHPQIFMAPGKELHFFDDHYDRGIEWYESRFAGAGDHKVVAEATPRYMSSPGAIRRISETLPRVRLVAILRNPVDRAYSHYWMEVNAGREEREFREAAESELQGDDSTAYLDQGRYIHQIRHIEAMLPRAPLHVMVTERLARMPKQSLRELFEFLDVDPGFTPAGLERRVNQHVQFRSQSLRRIARRSPSRLVRRGLEALITKKTDYPPLDDELRCRLESAFADDVGDLAGHLDLDLASWWWTGSSP